MRLLRIFLRHSSTTIRALRYVGLSCGFVAWGWHSRFSQNTVAGCLYGLYHHFTLSNYFLLLSILRARSTVRSGTVLVNGVSGSGDLMMGFGLLLSIATALIKDICRGFIGRVVRCFYSGFFQVNMLASVSRRLLRVGLILLTIVGGLLRFSSDLFRLPLFFLMFHEWLIGAFHRGSTQCRVLVSALRGNIWVLIAPFRDCGVRLYLVR